MKTKLHPFRSTSGNATLAACILLASVAGPPAQSDPPPLDISDIKDQTVLQGVPIPLLDFTVTDRGAPPERLSLAVVSDNPVLVPNSPSALKLTGSSRDWTLEVTPDPFYSGLANIKVQVTDGTLTASDTFTLTVEPDPMIWVTGLTVPASQQLHFQFLDTGTGSTDYLLESRPGLGEDAAWSGLTNVAIRRLGFSQFEADVAPPEQTPTVIYRVRGSAPATASANFGSSELQIEEGAGPVYLMLLFDKPFIGTLYYAMEGPDRDTLPGLSGTAKVHGSTASIPLIIPDDLNVGTLRHLTLRLVPGPDYRVGSGSQYSLTVLENDADWQGGLLLSNKLTLTCTSQIVYRTNDGTSDLIKTNNASLPLNTQNSLDFVLRIQRSGSTCAGVLTSDGLGFFPANEWPAAITLSEDAFAATVDNIQLPTDSTLLGVPVLLSLKMTALNTAGQTNVTPTEIQGQGTLTMRYSGLPYLDTTNSGQFVLMKPPTRLSTNEVKLTNEVTLATEPF